jgi:hypothetical protein
MLRCTDCSPTRRTRGLTFLGRVFHSKRAKSFQSKSFQSSVSSLKRIRRDTQNISLSPQSNVSLSMEYPFCSEDSETCPAWNSLLLELETNRRDTISRKCERSIILLAHSHYSSKRQCKTVYLMSICLRVWFIAGF